MKRIVNNSKQYTSSVFRYAGTPHPVSSKYKTLQRIGLFRNIGILLGLCKDYVGLDTEILKKAGMGIVSTASEKKVADAIKKYKKSEPAKVKNNQKKYKTQLTEAESLSRLKQALSMFLHAAQVIEKKGGKIVFDEQQLLHYLRLGRNEFPNDSLLSSLAKKLSLGREGSSNIPDATDAFQKIKESSIKESKSSTLVDLESGKRTEVDYLNGMIIREGEAHGVPTPINKVLYLILKALEQKNINTSLHA